MPEGALLDTSFFIRFLNEKDELFENADKYYQYFLKKEIRLFISTISIAEYCVGGSIDQLPLRNLIDYHLISNTLKKPANLPEYFIKQEKIKILKLQKGQLL